MSHRIVNLVSSRLSFITQSACDVKTDAGMSFAEFFRRESVF